MDLEQDEALAVLHPEVEVNTRGIACRVAPSAAIPAGLACWMTFRRQRALQGHPSRARGPRWWRSVRGDRTGRQVEGSGMEQADTVWYLATLRSGLIVRFDAYFDRKEALEAAGAVGARRSHRLLSLSCHAGDPRSPARRDGGHAFIGKSQAARVERRPNALGRVPHFRAQVLRNCRKSATDDCLAAAGRDPSDTGAPSCASHVPLTGLSGRGASKFRSTERNAPVDRDAARCGTSARRPARPPAARSRRSSSPPSTSRRAPTAFGQTPLAGWPPPRRSNSPSSSSTTSSTVTLARVLDERVAALHAALALQHAGAPQRREQLLQELERDVAPARKLGDRDRLAARQRAQPRQLGQRRTA